MTHIDPMEDDAPDGAIEDILRTFDTELDETHADAEMVDARGSAAAES